MEIPEAERKNRTDAIIEETMVDNFLKPTKDIKLQLLEVLETLKVEKQKNYTLLQMSKND